MTKKHNLSSSVSSPATPARTKTPRVTAAKHSKVPTPAVDRALVEIDEESSLDSRPLSSSAVAAKTLSAAPNAHETIAEIAYGYWEARGYHGGSAFDDWLQAEEEFRQRFPSIV